MEIVIYIWLGTAAIGFLYLFGYFAYNVFGWDFIDQYYEYKKFINNIEREEEKESKRLDYIIDVLEYNRKIQKLKNNPIDGIGLNQVGDLNSNDKFYYEGFDLGRDTYYKIY